MLVRNGMKLTGFLALVCVSFLGFPRGILAQSTLPNATEIQAEIAPTVRRIAPALNTWILIAVIVSTSTVTTVLILVVISVQNFSQTHQKINQAKQTSLSELTDSLSAAQQVVNDLEYSIKTSEYKISKISSQVLSSSEQKSD